MPRDHESTSPVWEMDYQRHLQDITVGRLRVTSLIVIFVVVLDGGIQFLSKGEILTELFWVRLAVSLMILAVLTLTYLKSASRVGFMLSLIGVLVVAADVEAAVAVTGVYRSPYQTGLALLIIAAGLLFPYTVRQMAVTCVLIWAVFLMPTMIGWQAIATSGSAFYTASFFLICSSVIAVTASYVISHLRRQEFFSELALKETFGKYVSAEIRDELLSGRIPLDGEMKEVTILFADLRDFTPMTESYDPKIVVKIMNSYFKEMAEAVRYQGGLVLQFIGDEIYAVFGAPVFRRDHPARAFQAGLAMSRRLVELNRRFVERGWPSLRHGIGIHTGEAVAANIGSPDRLSYLLVGDTVNVASRLQSLTKEVGTEMIVSAATYARLPDTELVNASLRKLPRIMMKGKSKPVESFTVEVN